MKKTIVIISFLILIIFPIVGITLSYNKIVSQQENVDSSWAQIESNLQRRSDLIPDIIKTVKAFMEHEKNVLNSTTEKRANLVHAITELESKNTMAPENNINNQIKSQRKISSSINNFFAIAENYPNLRSSDQFLSLQAELEGSENRINVARLQYNNSVETFNATIKRFPNNLIASQINLKPREYFKAPSPTKPEIKL